VDFVRDISRHGVAGGGPGRRTDPSSSKYGPDYRASGLLGRLHGLLESSSRTGNLASESTG
jgi:hypothetical protein